MTIVVPTIGRPSLLRQCLESLIRCEPRAREVIVVDQSGANEVAYAVEVFARYGVGVVTDRGRGRGRAVNAGVRAASYPIVMVTDDDCTVRSDWVDRGADLISAQPQRIVTGRVLPVGNSSLVPSTKLANEPAEYTNTHAHAVLYAGNMACRRDALLEIGGFDERIVPSAEDNDLCYRWLRGGRALCYEPSLTIWHHDWRTLAELRAHYRGYARGEGMFYAKHLRQGDLMLLRNLVGELVAGIRGRAALLGRRSDWSDPRASILPAILQGLLEGWTVFRDP